MTDRPRHQRDLFEIPVAPMSIPIGAQARMVELLETLLREALSGEPAAASDAGGEVDHDEDHA